MNRCDLAPDDVIEAAYRDLCVMANVDHDSWQWINAMPADHEPRARYGSGTTTVVGVPERPGSSGDAPALIVRERGDNGVRCWNHADPAPDRLGRDRHFSQRDHRLISGLLNDHLARLGLAW